MKHALFRFIGMLVVFGVTAPDSAQAIQTHAAPEGLYIHQLGHVLFALAMFGFAYRIRHSRLRGEKSWLFMAIGAGLLGLWNGWAFAGHVFSVDTLWLQAKFDVHPGLHVVSSYAQMDHLLCVPALFCIYLSLRKMTVDSRKRRAKEAD
jgi:hypothetical protein